MTDVPMEITLFSDPFSTDIKWGDKDIIYLPKESTTDMENVQPEG